MPEDDGYLISEADLRRITKVVRKEERSNKSKPVKRRRDRTPHWSLNCDVVKARNEVGSSVPVGYWVCLFERDATGDLEARSEYAFAAQRHNLTALTHSQYTYRYGIALETLPTSGHGMVQISGVCMAKVNVAQTYHTHAFPFYTNSYLQSGYAGVAEILSPITGTGEQECIVRLGPSHPPILVASVNAGGATADVLYYSGSWGSTSRSVDIINSGFGSLGTGQRVVLSWDGMTSSYIVISKVV